MELKKVFKGIKYELVNGMMEEDITGIEYDSRKIMPGNLFVCLVGANMDGHDYIDMAIKNGATAILVSKEVKEVSGITIILVEDTRKVLAKIGLNFYNYPQSKLKTIAITGTKGKTTTSFMIKNILSLAGKKCGLIGTTGIYIDKKKYEAKNTTPESLDTIKYMNEMVKNKIEYMVMEVSSQALKYDRVNDIIFDYGMFTNLSQDHIGENEHTSMNDYISSKAKLFKQCNYGIFNIDDDHFYDMVMGGDSTINTFGYSEKADLKAIDTKLIREDNFIGIELKTSGVIEDTFRISMPGKFTSYNAMGAILVAYLLGIDVKYIKKALINFSVLGRCEAISVSDKFSLLIDYAHNGVSTESILTTMKEYNPKRIVTIFGCGGNRSKDRRYEMGEITSKYSDYCIITEDNNRYEEFQDIANDILEKFDKKCDYIVIPDRKEAIKHAILNACDGDIIMLLGKGHEDYKEIKGKRIHFDEREVIKEILDEINK